MTAGIGWTTAVGVAAPRVVAPGVAAAMVEVAVVTVRVATPTTAVEGTVVAEAEEARLRQVVVQDAVQGLVDEAAGAVAPALGEVAVDDRTAREVVRLETVLLSARPRLQAWTKVTVVTAKWQVTPSLVDVASSTERLSKRSLTGHRAKPVSSRLAHARTAAIAAADAAADARHEAFVRRAYVTLGLKEAARIATPPFPAFINKAAGAQ